MFQYRPWMPPDPPEQKRRLLHSVDFGDQMPSSGASKASLGPVSDTQGGRKRTPRTKVLAITVRRSRLSIIRLRYHTRSCWISSGKATIQEDGPGRDNTWPQCFTTTSSRKSWLRKQRTVRRKGEGERSIRGFFRSPGFISQKPTTRSIICGNSQSS